MCPEPAGTAHPERRERQIAEVLGDHRKPDKSLRGDNAAGQNNNKKGGGLHKRQLYLLFHFAEQDSAADYGEQEQNTDHRQLPRGKIVVPDIDGGLDHRDIHKGKRRRAELQQDKVGNAPRTSAIWRMPITITGCRTAL